MKLTVIQSPDHWLTVGEIVALPDMPGGYKVIAIEPLGPREFLLTRGGSLIDHKVVVTLEKVEVP